MIEETLQETKNSIGKAHDALRRELSRVRTGRASPELLDSIRVDYYGTPTPVSQMASIAVPEPRLLTIKPWEKSSIKLIEFCRLTGQFIFQLGTGCAIKVVKANI